MLRPPLTVLLIASAAACGPRRDRPVRQFTIMSTAFQNGQTIARQFTCDGEGQSPPLSWSEPPRGTRSFALVVDDPDSPKGTFHHWGAYDIPVTARSIVAGGTVGSQVINDFGKLGYGGPCPPPGAAPHHYRFKLYALGIDRLRLDSGSRVTDIEREAKPYLVGRAELTAAYGRK